MILGRYFKCYSYEAYQADDMAPDISSLLQAHRQLRQNSDLGRHFFKKSFKMKKEDDIHHSKIVISFKNSSEHKHSWTDQHMIELSFCFFF
jgi:hypothetical protein